MPSNVERQFIARYALGSWMALSGRSAWLLIDASPDDPVIDRAWSALDEGIESLESVLDKWIAETRRGFAALATRPLSLYVLVSRLGSAKVAGASDTDELEQIHLTCPTGVDIATYRIPVSVHSVTLASSGEARETSLPIGTGVAQASLLSVSWPKVAEVDLAPSDTVRETPLESIWANAETISPFDDLPAIHAAAQSPEVTPEPMTDAAIADDYDHLFGHTVARTVDGAAVRVEEPSSSEVETPAVAAAPPLAAAGAIATLATRVNLTPDFDVPDLTIERSMLAAPSGDGGRVPSLPPVSPLSPSSAPLVKAVRCPSGHANPRESTRCRNCDALVASQQAVLTPRPVLGVLRLSTGDSVSLDRDAILGRQPSWDRTDGPDRPNLVKVPSPRHDVSRNHLQVRIDDWQVLVTDLGSTNGTIITRPGGVPETLSPGKPTVIEPGTEITLGDESSFAYHIQ